MIEICVSCYNPPGQSQYSALLRYQIASLVLAPPNCNVSYNVFYTGEANDPETHRVLWDADDVGYLMGKRSINFRPIAMTPDLLFRRAISRDRACRDMHRDAEAIFFTDADYFFLDGFIDTANMLAQAGTFVLGFPRLYWINTTHDIGDGLIRNVPEFPNMAIPAESLFTRRKAKVAIGGIQLVHRDAIHHGYLRDTKWTEKVDPALGFRSCKCDKAFRRFHSQEGRYFIPLDIPGLRRIRHSVDGRDYSATGEKIGKTSW